MTIQEASYLSCVYLIVRIAHVEEGHSKGKVLYQAPPRFLSYFYVCVWILCVYAHAGICTCVHVCGVEVDFSFSFSVVLYLLVFILLLLFYLYCFYITTTCFPVPLLRQSLSLSPEVTWLVRLTSQWVPGIPYFCPWLVMGAGNPNSGSHACIALFTHRAISPSPYIFPKIFTCA